MKLNFFQRSFAKQISQRTASLGHCGKGASSNDLSGPPLPATPGSESSLADLERFGRGGA